MRPRLTPLNIISSLLLLSIAWLFIFADDPQVDTTLRDSAKNGWHRLGAIPLIVLFLLSFIADMIFRWFLKDLKRIWIVELVFIIFVAILILIIQRQSV